MTNKINVGDKAPDFTLIDTNLKPRSLSEFLGNKIVLAFFVGAFTSVCTKEMCTFRDSMARLISLKAKVIGIAVTDPFSNKAFAEKNFLPFPILSDHKREVIRTYGIELPDFAGLKGYSTGSAPFSYWTKRVSCVTFGYQTIQEWSPTTAKSRSS